MHLLTLNCVFQLLDLKHQLMFNNDIIDHLVKCVCDALKQLATILMR